MAFQYDLGLEGLGAEGPDAADDWNEAVVGSDDEDLYAGLEHGMQASVALHSTYHAPLLVLKLMHD